MKFSYFFCRLLPKTCMLVALLCAASDTIFAQANYWSVFGGATTGCTTNYDINRMSCFGTPTAASFTEQKKFSYFAGTTPSSYADNYKTSAYDGSGNLLFSVNPDGIFAPDGTQEMDFADPLAYPITISGTDYYPQRAVSEISIFPEPGHPNNYYVAFFANDEYVDHQYEMRVITVTIGSGFPAASSITCTDNMMHGSNFVIGNHGSPDENPFHFVIAVDAPNSDCSRDIYTIDPQFDPTGTADYVGTSKMRKWHIANSGTLPTAPYTYSDYSGVYQTNAYCSKAKILNIGGVKYLAYISGATGSDLQVSGHSEYGYYLALYTITDASSIYSGGTYYPVLTDPTNRQIFGFDYVKGQIYFSYTIYGISGPTGGGLGYWDASGGITYSANDTHDYENTDLELDHNGDLFMVKGTSPTSGGDLAYWSSSSPVSATITPAVCSTACSTAVSVKNNIYVGAAIGYYNDAYYLGSQIRGEDYFSWGGTASGGYTVTTNETWTPTTNPFGNTSTIEVNGITILPDASLTINSLTVLNAPNTFIDVNEGDATHKGGRLTLNNTTLTVGSEACGSSGSMWGGVRVWGVSNLPQAPIATSPQAILTMSVSTISYAHIGAAVGQPIPSPFPLPPFTLRNGGIINASGSNFTDNNIGVEFYPYRNIVLGSEVNNRSSFDKCSFTTDDPATVAGTLYHVYGNGVKGVTFSGCNFTNIAGSTYPSYAIYGNNMGFYAGPSYTGVPPFATYTYGSFTNFATAIYQTTNNGYTVNINNNTFTSNNIGVSLNGTPAPWVVYNTFHVPAPIAGYVSGRPVSLRSIGLWLNTATLYTVYGNTCDAAWLYGNLAGNQTTGILATNTEVGHEDNLINNNSFNGLGTANLSNFRNNRVYTDGTSTLNYGLWYKCNANKGNVYDIAVRGANNMVDGIRIFQGYPVGSAYAGYASGLPAGNTFTTASTTAQYNLYNDGQCIPFDYYYSPVSQGGTPTEQPGAAATALVYPSGMTIFGITTNTDQCALPGGLTVAANLGNHITIGNKQANRVDTYLAVINNVNYYMTDTNGVTHRDSLYYWAGQLNSAAGDMLIAHLLVEDSLIDSANAVYDSIPGKYALDSMEMIEYTQGRNLLDITISQRINFGGDITALDSAQADSLHDVMSNSNGWAYVCAEHWLHDVDSTVITDSVLYPIAPTPTPPGPNGVLAVTEISNGPSGSNCEYVELVVADCKDDTTAAKSVNVEGWIIDDNSGNFNVDGCGSSNTSSSKGHYRLAHSPVWENVPVGSIIILYNHDDNCYNLPDYVRVDTGKTNLVYWVPIGGTWDAPYGVPLVERYFSRPSRWNCNYCGDSVTNYSTASEWAHTIGLNDDADAIQVRCPGCDSTAPGEPSFYHGIGYGDTTGDNAFASIAPGKSDLGGPVKVGSGGGYKLVFKGNTAADLGNPSAWGIGAADTAGAIPSSLGSVGTTFMSAITHHALGLPCCGSSGGEERRANSGSGSNGFSGNAARGISVYPNPANTVLYFTFPLTEKTTIRLMDISGRLMDEQVIDNNTTTSFDVHSYAPGIYLYQVITGSTTKSGKVVIQQ